MRYLKLYIKMHLKYWFLYLIMLFVFFPSLIISLFFGFMLGGLGVSNTTAWIIIFLTGCSLTSSPLLYANYKLAINATQQGISKLKTVPLMLISQIPSFLIAILLFLSVFYLDSF